MMCVTGGLPVVRVLVDPVECVYLSIDLSVYRSNYRSIYLCIIYMYMFI